MTTPPPTLGVRKSLEPWVLDSIEYYEHQITGIRWMSKKGSFICADDMGLGKSLEAITTFAVDIKLGYSSKMIVVCPVSLKDNWADELDKFTRIPYVVLGNWDKKSPMSVVKRTQQILEFAAKPGPKVLIVNYEQVSSHLPELNAIGFDIRVFDEGHYLQNHKAKRTKACMALFGRRTFHLTGSPMLAHVDGLWTLLNMVAPGEFPSYYTFLNRYAVFGGYKDKQIIGVKNEKELIEKLQYHMIRRLKEEVLNLKEPQIIQVRVDLHPEQRKLYEQAEEEMQITLPGNPTPMMVDNALTKALRLKQICGTTAAFEGYGDHSYKLDRSTEMLVELAENGHKTIVYTQFRDVLEAQVQRAKKEGLIVYELHGHVPKEQRIPLVRAWSADPRPAVIACMIQVAGIGLNMTASRHMIFLDKLWTPMLNRQAIDRANRIGQDETQSVQVFELICKGTVENRVEQILRVKKKLFEALIEESDYKRRLVAALFGHGDD